MPKHILKVISGYVTCMNQIWLVFPTLAKMLLKSIWLLPAQGLSNLSHKNAAIPSVLRGSWDKSTFFSAKSIPHYTTSSLLKMNNVSSESEPKPASTQNICLHNYISHSEFIVQESLPLSSYICPLCQSTEAGSEHIYEPCIWERFREQDTHSYLPICCLQ